MDSAEINIPERTPPPMVALEVVDKGAPAPGGKNGDSNPFSEPEIPGTDGQYLAENGLLSPLSPPGGLRARLGLDIDIETPGRTFVRGRGIDSEWKGLFHVTGSAIEPSITGNASLVRGHLSLLGKRFALTKGIVQFGGGWPPAPALDVESETQLKDMTGFLKVSGTTAAPTVTIESDPPAARDEILARMLFNRDMAHVSPIEALQLAEAADVLAGRKGLFQFTERARKILRVDNIDVAQDNGDMKDSSVRVGKYLRNDVYVQVEQGLGAETGKVQTEVSITPNLSVESTVDRNAKTGIGLKWKKDY
jgi:translocation and assembly module TamB